MALVTGAKEGKYMNKKIVYNDEPIRAKVIKDFLPKPEDLALKEDRVKVTLELTKKSVDFFKQAALRNQSAYQAMIRRLLDYYVAQQ